MSFYFGDIIECHVQYNANEAAFEQCIATHGPPEARIVRSQMNALMAF